MNEYKYKYIFPYDPFVEVSYEATRGIRGISETMESVESVKLPVESVDAPRCLRKLPVESVESFPKENSPVLWPPPA